MLKKIAIKTLYPLALAEGEGVGTAYEYYAKRLLLSRWLAHGERPSRILVAGLPQKYGASLDFLLLAAELRADLTVIDDRDSALGRCRNALKEIQQAGQLVELTPQFILTQDLESLPELNDNFDLALSSEVLQRLPAKNRLEYISRMYELAHKIALFTPNGDNPAHTNLSGLSGLPLSELEQVAGQAFDSLSTGTAEKFLLTGHIDMPPFPPGMIRTADQREQATTGKGEALAMWGLAYYAQMERWFPRDWRQRKSHIVYAFLNRVQR